MRKGHQAIPKMETRNEYAVCTKKDKGGTKLLWDRTMKVEIIAETPKRIPQHRTAVILTSYGRDKLLRKAIDSVLFQRDDDLNLIIIDDNSPTINKKTQKIIKERAKGDDRIIYFRTNTTDQQRAKKSTFARNINFMLKFLLRYESIVKYVMYLPCDDCFYRNRVSSAVKFLEKHQNVTSCWNYIKVVNPGRQFISKIPNMPQRAIGNPVAILDHSCVTHRLELLHRMQYPYWPIRKASEHCAPDGEFFMKLAVCGSPIQPAGSMIAGEKLRHGSSIQGRIHGW